MIIRTTHWIVKILRFLPMWIPVRIETIRVGNDYRNHCKIRFGR